MEISEDEVNLSNIILYLIAYECTITKTEI